jgi:hypothetical protein
MTFGDGTSGDVYFEDVNQILGTKDHYRSFTTANRTSVESLISENHYTITVDANSGGTSNFQLGAGAGDRGIQGCVIKSPFNRKLDVTVSGENLDLLKFYGCNFTDADKIEAPTTTVSGLEIIDCSFNDCGEVVADDCLVKYCNFVNADTRGVTISGSNHRVTYCNFITCPSGINITNSGTYAFNNLQFSGCTYDIENSSTGAVIINATDSNPSTYINMNGGTTTIINTVDLSVNVEDENGDAIEGASVRISKTVDNSEITNDTTDIDGNVTDQYNYDAGDIPITIRVRKSSPGQTRYSPFKTSGTIEDTGFTLTVVMSVDTNVAVS